MKLTAPLALLALTSLDRGCHGSVQLCGQAVVPFHNPWTLHTGMGRTFQALKTLMGQEIIVHHAVAQLLGGPPA